MKSIVKISLLTLVLIILSGCRYYEAVSKSNPGKGDVIWAQYNNKRFYIHSGSRVFGLTEVKTENDTLTALIGSEWLTYGFLEANPKGGALNEKNEQLLNEVHLYLLNPANLELPYGSVVKIPLSEIKSLNTYQPDKGRSATNTVLGCLAIPAAGVVILAIYWAFYPPSCPYLYVMNGENQELIGEIFGGAVYRPLERDDYLLLPPGNGQFTLKVRNELSEIQYINKLDLLQVGHPEGSVVIPDRYGNLFTVVKPTEAVAAVSGYGTDLSILFKEKDKKSFLFDETPDMTGDTCAFNTVMLTCMPPATADSVKLIINGGNQVWADFQVDRFTRLFGHRYDDWISRQNKTDGSEALKWQHDQQLFIEVFIETDTGWRYADYFELTGPMGRRDLIMLLPVVRNAEGSMRVKLSTGFMFWEVDFVAFDWSEQQPLTVKSILPYAALTEKGRDVRRKMFAADENYYIQYVPGEEVVLEYTIPEPEPGCKSSLVFHSRGYYEHVRNYTFEPDMGPLLRMKEKGRLSRVSCDNFQQSIRASSATVNDIQQ